MNYIAQCFEEARLLTANIYQLREFNAPEKRSRYIFANRVANTRKEKPSTKIEREKIMKSPCENSTFGFYQHAKKPNQKNQKSNFFPTLKKRNKIEEYANNLRQHKKAS